MCVSTVVRGRKADRGEEKSNKERRKNEEKEIIISPNGPIEGGRILSRAISHLYANLHY